MADERGTRVRGTLRLFGINFAVLLALALLVELGTRAASVRFPALPGPNVPDRALWQRDPTLGWSLRPGASGRIDLGGPDEGLIRVNSLGLRGGEVALRKADGVFRVLAMGDSYVLGVGVDEAHLFTTRLQSLLSETLAAEVVNMGVNGYSTDQQLLQYEALGQRLNADLVILVACDNDFDGIEEDFAYRAYYKPYFELISGALVRRNIPIPELSAPQRAKLWLGRHINVWNAVRSRRSDNRVVQSMLEGLQVAVPRRPSNDTMELMEALLVSLHDQTTRAGAPLVLFNSAHRGERTTLFQDLRARLRQRGIPFLGLEGNLGAARAAHPEGRWDFSEDRHWNVDAHRLVAEVVATFLREQRLVPAPASGRLP